MNKSEILQETTKNIPTNTDHILISQEKHEVSDCIERGQYVDKETILEYLTGFPNVNFYEISCIQNTGIKEIENLIKNYDLDANNEEEDISTIKKNETRNNSRETSCILF